MHNAPFNDKKSDKMKHGCSDCSCSEKHQMLYVSGSLLHMKKTWDGLKNKTNKNGFVTFRLSKNEIWVAFRPKNWSCGTFVYSVNIEDVTSGTSVHNLTLTSCVILHPNYCHLGSFLSLKKSTEKKNWSLSLFSFPELIILATRYFWI